MRVSELLKALMAFFMRADIVKREIANKNDLNNWDINECLMIKMHNSERNAKIVWVTRVQHYENPSSNKMHNSERNVKTIWVTSVQHYEKSFE